MILLGATAIQSARGCSRSEIAIFIFCISKRKVSRKRSPSHTRQNCQLPDLAPCLHSDEALARLICVSKLSIGQTEGKGEAATTGARRENLRDLAQAGRKTAAGWWKFAAGVGNKRGETSWLCIAAYCCGFLVVGAWKAGQRDYWRENKHSGSAEATWLEIGSSRRRGESCAQNIPTTADTTSPLV